MQLQSPKKPGEPARKKLTMDDFDKLSRLGQGAYGEVFLVFRKDLEKKFALKMIEKKFLSQEKKQYQAMVEKEVLCRLNHPGIVKLSASFTDPKRLYFVMEYCQGGQFKDFLKMNYGVLTEPMAAFYVGQIVNVLEYLHSNGIVHRDLKPENLMLSKTGHIKLIDFGTAQISQCKLLTQEFKDLIEEQKKVKQAHQNQELDKVQPGLQKEISRRSSFVGTCYYISPQLLQNNICQPPSDLWALGCIIYQLYYGKTPFWDKQQFLVFQRIRNVQYQMPPNDHMPDEARDLIRRLLVKNPMQRLGASNVKGYTYEDLKKHPFFLGKDINNLFNEKPPEAPEFEPQKIKQKQELIKVKETYERRVTEEIQKKNSNDLLIHGLVEKKKFIMYSPIFLVIKRNLEVEMFKPEQQDKKKVAKIESGSLQPAQLVSSQKFTLATEGKKYTFRVEEANVWVDMINGQVYQLSKTKK